MAEGLHITRPVSLPDERRLARYRRAPELGPRVLFFSGGSALNPLCRELVEHTHNSIHLITPFDSGGSSAELRRVFAMPAVGDLRNRMMALADRSLSGHPQVHRLFAHRLGKDRPRPELMARLEAMAAGKDPLVAAVPDPMRKIIRSHLGFFLEAAPAEFNPRGASIGNLVLVGGYLNSGRHLGPVVFLFSKLAEVRGTVRPIVNQYLHLAAELADGSVFIGQHLLTGREAPPLTQPIKRLFLSSQPERLLPASPAIPDKTRALVASSELICFPVGSFYTSLMANLLPAGVGAAVAAADCPKVFIPNTGFDPELIGLNLTGQVRILLRQLEAGGAGPAGQALQFVLLDSAGAEYAGGVDRAGIEALGVRVIDCPLVSAASRPLLDPRLLCAALLSLV